MVRLSLVNMYLHGFVDPHIYEYDTLTSQDRWNEYADVIMANPPLCLQKEGSKRITGSQYNPNAVKYYLLTIWPNTSLQMAKPASSYPKESYSRARPLIRTA